MKKKNIILTVSIALAVVLAGTASFFVWKNSFNSGTVVGFYNIPENITNIYKEIITKDTTEKIEFIEITEEDLQKNKVEKKADVIITYNGAVTQNLKSKAADLPADFPQKFSRTVASSPLYNYENKMKIFPISFDMLETMVLTTAVEHYNLPLPATTEEIDIFGQEAIKTYPFPIVISAGNDFVINNFFTQLVEAFGGITAYKNIADQLREDKNMYNFYDYTVLEKNGKTEKITVSSILDLVKTWEKSGTLSRNWHKMTAEQTAQLIEDNRVSMAIMTLQEHRKVTSRNLNYYETIIFPPMAEYNDGQRASIQPAIVGMMLTDTPETKIIASRLTTVENQELISLQTQLGPVTLQGTAFDSQANDARFVAASFPAGPVPDLATLVFEDKESQHKMAELIRNYK